MTPSDAEKAALKYQITDFPDELLLKIFQLATESTTYWKFDPAVPNKDAYSLCLVCRTFLGPATQVLYTNVVIQEKDDIYTPMWQSFFDSDAALKDCRKLTVKCTFLGAGFKQKRQNEPFPPRGPDHFKSMLQKLPKLICVDDFGKSVYWQFNSPWRPDGPPPIESFGRDIHVSYQNISMMIFQNLRLDAFHWMMHSLPCLKRLLVRGTMNCDSRRPVWDKKFPDKPATTTLEELHIGRLGCHVGWLLSRSKSLTQFSVGTIHSIADHCGMPPEYYLQDIFRALRKQRKSLEYLGLPRIYHDERLFKEQGLDMAEFTALRTLYMRGHNLTKAIRDSGYNVIAPNLRSFIVERDYYAGNYDDSSRQDLLKFMEVTVSHALRTREMIDVDGAAVLQRFNENIARDSSEVDRDTLTGVFRDALQVFGVSFECVLGDMQPRLSSCEGVV